MQRIFTYGFSDNLIKKVSDHAFDNFISKGIDPSRLCFVFGGRRPSLFLRKELSRKRGGAMISPAFFTMEGYLTEIATAKEPVSFMPDIEAAYLIYRLSREHFASILGKRGSFAEFLPWAYEILSFMNMADMENVSREALENIEANAGIGYDIPKNINEMLKNISSLREYFHAEAEKNRTMTRGMLYSRASRLAKDFSLDKYDAVFFGGVFYLSKAEETAVKAAMVSGKGVIFFQGDSSEWPVLKELEKTFSCEIKADGKRDTDVKLYCGYGTHAQSSIAKQIIGGIKDTDNSVLILPEPQALMPVISGLTSVIADFNVSLGYPVEKSSLFSLIEAVFKAQETKNGEEYYTRDYLGVLLHPLAKNMKLPYDPNVTRMLIHKVEEALTVNPASGLCGRMYILPDDVLNEETIFSLLQDSGINTGRDELKGILSSFNDFFFKSWENIKTFSSLYGVARDFASGIAEKSFARHYPLNSKAIESFISISMELKNASFGSELLASRDMLKILLARLKEEYVSFPGTPLKGFQLLGLLESRSLNFDNVIVMNANETILPKLKASEPLIPREVMLTLGMKHIEKEEEIQKYEFFRLIGGAKNAHIIYSSSEENERSRFIEEILWKKEKQSGEIKLKAASYGFRAETSPDKMSFTKTPEIIAFLKNMRYTATKINSYLECPSRFYFRYVLNIKEREIYSDEPEGSEIGRFVHEFLFKHFSVFVGQKPVYDAAFEKDFLNSLVLSFEEAFSKRMRAGSFLAKEVLLHRMRQFLESERERNPARIVALEKKYSGTIDIGTNIYAFESRIDRIDELESGELLVIDYKTGGQESIRSKSGLPENIPFSRESIKKYLGSFQLPLYVNLVRRVMSGKRIDAALYDLRTPELISFYKDSDDKARGEKDAFCAKSLAFIMSEINDASLAFIPDDPDTQKCASCPYFYMCR